jgi:hypothetical protein
VTDASVTRRRALIAGLAAIVVANVAALAGAAWNRSGEPESTLQLTDRELELPGSYEGRDGPEDSGLSLGLLWRTLTLPPGDTSVADWNEFAIDRGPRAYWLDSTKLSSLGFDVRTFAGRPEAEAFYRRQRPRVALIVLEMDGPAHRTAVDRVRRLAAHQEARRAANPDAPPAIEQLRNAGNRVSEEERDASRLFAIDAGFDREALRAAYPDRTRHAIVRGTIRIDVEWGDGPPLIVGVIDTFIDDIHVPRQFRPVVDSVRPTFVRGRETLNARYAGQVAFGRRLEPWLMSLTRRQ